MSLPSTARAIWKSAELLIAFHKNRKHQKRNEPRFWRPDDGKANLASRPEDKEAVILMKGYDAAENVQIKMHSDKIVVRRAPTRAWSGIIADDDFVRVLINGVWIRINPDGGIVIERASETTYLEEDGSILRISPEAEITVSGDGTQMSRRTDEKIDVITEDGVLSKWK